MFQIQSVNLLNREGDVVDSWFVVINEATNEIHQFRNWVEVDTFLRDQEEK